MSQLNFWFTPRSRSTALLRCLSNIPESKIMFEKFIWCYVAEKAPGLLAMIGLDPNSVPTNEQLLEELQKDPSRIKIIKEVSKAVKPEVIPKLITKDSINIFLVRHPALITTSPLPGTDLTYYENNMNNSPDGYDVRAIYDNMLKTINYAEEKCTITPLVISSETLSTKEGSIAVVKKICSLIGVEFSQDLLIWESYDSFDPKWDVPPLAKAVEDKFGHFTRANRSTGFEDMAERSFNLDQIRIDKPETAAEIDRCVPPYEEIMKLATKF